MDKFDYEAPTDLFPPRNARPVSYRRFGTAAEAIRYAVEEMPAQFFKGTVLENEGDRLNADNILSLYHSERYPLARKRTAS